MTVQEINSIHKTIINEGYSEDSSESLEAKITAVHISAFSVFVNDYKSRITTFRENPEVLTKGMFYTNEHFLAMKEAIGFQAKTLEGLESSLRQLEEQLESDMENPELLKKQVKLKEQIQGAKSLQEKLNGLFDRLFDNGHYFHGFRNSDYFKPNPSFMSITGYQPNGFRVKSGAIPSEVVSAYTEGLTLTDCASTILAAKYKALLDLWGEEKFNIVFAVDSSSPIGFHSGKSGMAYFVQGSGKYAPLSGEKNQQHVTRGRNYYMEGIRLYHAKHYNGEAQGFNLLCTSDEPGNQKYIGFGLPTNGATEEEVLQVLVNEYNREPIGGQIVPEKLQPFFSSEEAQAKKLVNHETDPEQFQKLGGGRLIDVAEKLNVDRIQEVINTPSENLRELVDGWVASDETLRKSQERTPQIVLVDGNGNQQECVIC